VPTASVREGRAEALPIDDASLDLVTFAQAWHWTNPPVAAAEAARVLVSGGLLAMLWNHADDRMPWVHELHLAEGRSGGAHSPTFMPPFADFAPGAELTVDWSEVRSAADYLDLAGTYSHLAVLDEAERQQRLDAIHAVLQRQPLDDLGLISIPQRCIVWRYRRL
jgi:SAM-dependent methyltransferase